MKPTINLFARISGILFLCLTFTYAHAGMISTQDVDASSNSASNHQIIQSTLKRNDVRNALLNNGVDPSYVEKRINQLTDQEIQQLANQLNELPAAGGAGLVLFATGPIIFMLELMGLTDLTTTF